MASSNIEKMLNVLDDNETDINKMQMYLTIFYSQAQ